MACLLLNGGACKDEAAIAENRDRTGEALRKQLAGDVEALAGAGIAVGVARALRELRREVRHRANVLLEAYGGRP